MKQGSSAELFRDLCNSFIHEWELRTHVVKDDRESDKKDRYYFPLPVLKRILALVGERRRQECGWVRIDYTDPAGGSLVAIPLPDGFDFAVDEDQPFVDLIAKHVNATILNRAMTVGFRNCMVRIIPPQKLPKGTAGGPWITAWLKAIEDWKMKDAFDVPVDRYLRDYRADASAAEFCEAATADVLEPIRVTDILPRVHDDSKSGSSTSPRYLVGIDLGGTLAKFAIYKVSASGTLDWVNGFAIQNVGGDGKVIPHAVFAEHLVARLGEFAQENKLILEENTIAVGVCWPGPVRNGVLRGTAGTLRFLENPSQSGKGFSIFIIENEIADIHRVNLIGALRQAWGKQFGSNSVTPHITLANDGEVHGLAVLHAFLADQPKRFRGDEIVAVIVVGTGLGGAVFRGGRLVQGLFEFGKMLQDVGAAPRRVDELKFRFPTGLANLLLKKTTLPALLMNQRPELRGFDSQEIGYMLETEAEGEKWFEQELGLRAYSRENSLDVEICRQALNSTAPRGFLQIVGKKLGVTPLKAPEMLAEMVKRFAHMRLDELRVLFNKQSSPSLTDIMNWLRSDCSKSVDAMAGFLGDFIVLLHDQAGVTKAIVCGGVASGTTGKLLVDGATKRITKYVDSPAIEIEGESGVILPPGDKLGTRGAALAGALSLLSEKRRHRIEDLKTWLRAIPAGKTFSLDGKNKQLTCADKRPFSFEMLAGDEIETFLKLCGEDLGVFYFVQTGEHESKVIKYRRMDRT